MQGSLYSSYSSHISSIRSCFLLLILLPIDQRKGLVRAFHFSKVNQVFPGPLFSFVYESHVFPYIEGPFKGIPKGSSYDLYSTD